MLTIKLAVAARLAPARLSETATGITLQEQRGSGTPKAEAFRKKQLDRLAEDQVEKVIESLYLLASGLEDSAKKEVVDRERAYLERNQERMR